MNAIVIVYQGCLDSVELYASKEKARKRYEEILKREGVVEADLSYSDYDIQLETDLKVQDAFQAIRLLDEALKKIQEFPYKDWDSSRVEGFLVNLQKVLK